MEMGEATQDAREDSSHFLGELSRAHAATPVPSLDQFHRVIRITRGEGAPVEDLDQVLVADLTEGVELTAKPHRLGGTDQLQGELNIADGVVYAVDTTGSALAEDRANAIASWETRECHSVADFPLGQDITGLPDEKAVRRVQSTEPPWRIT